MKTNCPRCLQPSKRNWKKDNHCHDCYEDITKTWIEEYPTMAQFETLVDNIHP